MTDINDFVHIDGEGEGDAASENLNLFCRYLKEFICFVGDNVDGAKEESKIIMFKLEAAIDLDAYKLCQRFVKELKPYISLIITRNPVFFTDACKKLPIIQNYTVLDRLVETTDPSTTKKIWKKLNELVTVGGFALESSSSLESGPHRTAPSSSPFDPQSFDPAFQQNDFAALFQSIMPMAMNMMGPMMEKMSGGQMKMPPMSASQQEDLKNQATDLNSPLMQMVSQMGGAAGLPQPGGAPPARPHLTAPQRPQLSSTSSKKKKNNNKNKKILNGLY